MKKRNRVKWSFILFAAVLVATAAMTACKRALDGVGGTGTSAYNYMTGVDLSSAKFTLVENGASQYCVVIPKDGSAEISGAAVELVEYIQKATGVTLTIKKDSDSGIDKFFSLGGTTQSRSIAKFDMEALKHDGFYLKSIDGNVYIDSKYDRGVCYGVYSFLERFISLRFLDWENTYYEENPILAVHEFDIKEEPIFQMREWYGWNSFTYKDYKKHARFYTGEDIFCNEVNNSHNATDTYDKPGIGYVNKSDIDPTDGQGRTLGVTHPEFFTDKLNVQKQDWDICWTSGITEGGALDADMEISVAKLFIEKVKRFITNDESDMVEYFMVGQMDNRAAMCKCTVCEARRTKYNESGIVIMFLNTVLREVNEWLQTDWPGREIKIVTFAYHRTTNPPVKSTADGEELISPLVKADSGIHIRWAPIDADFTYSFKDKRQYKEQLTMIENWKLAAENFMVWDYQTNFVDYYYYWPTTHYLKENIEFYSELGVTYLMNQAAWNGKNIWNDSIKSYITSRLCWNLNWDVELLLNEYLELYYGIGAPYVKNMINMIEWNFNERLQTDELKLNILNVSSDFLSSKYYPISLLENMLGEITAAIELVEKSGLSAQEKSKLLKKLELVSLTPHTITLRNYDSYYLFGKIDYAREFFDIIDKYEITKMGEAYSVAAERQKYGL